MIDFNNALGYSEPNDANVYNSIKVTEEGSKDEYDLAIEHYTKALEKNPNDAGAYYSIANSYYMKGELDLAILNYSKVIEIDENHAGAYNARGSVYASMGQGKRANRNYDLAIENIKDTDLHNSINSKKCGKKKSKKNVNLHRRGRDAREQ